MDDLKWFEVLNVPELLEKLRSSNGDVDCRKGGSINGLGFAIGHLRQEVLMLSYLYTAPITLDISNGS